MRRLFFIAFAATALTACGSKSNVVENGSAVENLSFESAPANDASALEAVEAEDSRSAALNAMAGNEVDDSATNNDAEADSNAAGNAD